VQVGRGLHPQLFRLRHFVARLILKSIASVVINQWKQCKASSIPKTLKQYQNIRKQIIIVNFIMDFSMIIKHA
jgi:hypothetical protein